jgi:prolipoprotein diacylglyceryltransferase
VWVFGGRFMIEFLKMPQVAFEQGLLLNMGQILSLPFIIWEGIALVCSFHKEKLESKNTMGNSIL